MIPAEFDLIAHCVHHARMSYQSGQHSQASCALERADKHLRTLKTKNMVAALPRHTEADWPEDMRTQEAT